MRGSTRELISYLLAIASNASSPEVRQMFAESMRFQKRCFGSKAYRDYIRKHGPYPASKEVPLGRNR